VLRYVEPTDQRCKEHEAPFLESYFLGNYFLGSSIPGVTDHVDTVLGQWQRERPDVDSAPVAVIGRISRLSRALEARLEPVYAAHGLDGGLFDVLATLRRQGSPYQLCPRDLADASMLTSSGTTKRLDRLEDAGLVVRKPDPEDRRGVLIELTPAGHKLIDAAYPRHMQNEDRLLDPLTKGERKQLASLLKKLLTGLEAG
jgi:DNA-binding MarR family transcriptional regulator